MAAGRGVAGGEDLELAGNALDPAEVREWAKAQGIEVKDRGRVPAELVARFKAATGKLGPECCRLAKARRSHSHADVSEMRTIA